MLNEMFDVIDKGSLKDDKAALHVKRRNELLSLIEQKHPGVSGRVFLFAPFEHSRHSFVQDSSFFYYTGISEPATALTFDSRQGCQLFMPDFAGLRDKWVHAVDVLNEQTISLFGIDQLQKLGQPVSGYQLYPYFSESDYQHMIDILKDMVAQKQTVFTLYPHDSYQYVAVKMIIDRLCQFVPGLEKYVVDISPLVAQMRRKKAISEIEHMYQAVAITHAGFQAATRLLRPGATEAEMQAAIEYIFTENYATSAYPSIVAGGKRSTILHYHANNQDLKDGEVVLIDAGAMFNHYCADITRTLPVSGTFTDRQKELYSIVLETQQHVVEHARPGVWLSNPKEPEMSLQHVAINFLKKKGYDKYFIHGVSHFLGLDVHDVGDRSVPLQEGDVITVEPGIYLPDESIGIRIEDNYWIVQDAEPVCLSESIPKSISEVEEMVEESFNVDVE